MRLLPSERRSHDLCASLARTRMCVPVLALSCVLCVCALPSSLDQALRAAPLYVPGGRAVPGPQLEALPARLWESLCADGRRRDASQLARRMAGSVRRACAALVVFFVLVQFCHRLELANMLHVAKLCKRCYVAVRVH